MAVDKSQMSETSQPIWKKGFKTLYKGMKREGKMKTTIHSVICQTFTLDPINIPHIHTYICMYTHTELMYIE